jgi:hypothetical protein
MNILAAIKREERKLEKQLGTPPSAKLSASRSAFCRLLAERRLPSRRRRWRDNFVFDMSPRRLFVPKRFHQLLTFHAEATSVRTAVL